MSGLVIIETMGGSHYCEDCHSDIRDPIQREREFDLFVRSRLDSGVCECCGAVVDAGELLDTAAAKP